jgi:hypothetical protein
MEIADISATTSPRFALTNPAERFQPPTTLRDRCVPNLRRFRVEHRLRQRYCEHRGSFRAHGSRCMIKRSPAAAVRMRVFGFAEEHIGQLRVRTSPRRMRAGEWWCAGRQHSGNTVSNAGSRNATSASEPCKRVASGWSGSEARELRGINLEQPRRAARRCAFKSGVPGSLAESPQHRIQIVLSCATTGSLKSASFDETADKHSSRAAIAVGATN